MECSHFTLPTAVMEVSQQCDSEFLCTCDSRDRGSLMEDKEPESVLRLGTTGTTWGETIQMILNRRCSNVFCINRGR